MSGNCVLLEDEILAQLMLNTDPLDGSSKPFCLELVCSTKDFYLLLKETKAQESSEEIVSIDREIGQVKLEYSKGFGHSVTVLHQEYTLWDPTKVTLDG